MILAQILVAITIHFDVSCFKKPNTDFIIVDVNWRIARIYVCVLCVIVRALFSNHYHIEKLKSNAWKRPQQVYENTEKREVEEKKNTWNEAAFLRIIAVVVSMEQ